LRIQLNKHPTFEFFADRAMEGVNFTARFSTNTRHMKTVLNHDIKTTAKTHPTDGGTTYTKRYTLT